MSYKISVVINSDSVILEHITRYLAAKHDILVYKVDGYRKNIYGKTEVDFKFGHHEGEIELDGEKIKIDYVRKGSPKATSYLIGYFEELKLSAERKEIIDNLILTAKKFSDEKDDKYITTKILKKGYWTILSRLPRRDLSTIYIDNKKGIINDIERFLGEEKVYNNFGIPYKRNYLFEGPPGAGKSSFIFAIASYFNREVNIVSFSPQLDDSGFMQAINNISENAIIVLEDVDSLFVGRKSNDMNACMISFSGILNFLDGVGRKHGMLCFLTTNYIDRLDPALKRAGRIDYIYTFDYVKEEQVKEMFEKFFPEQKDDFDKFYDRIRGYKFTASILQEFFFKNRDEKKIVKKANDLLRMIEDRQETKSDNSSMYI